ncbi:MAG: molybdopterin-dependent oxidoreductase [Eggerthellaceae bacterium]|nr:molybdopterin-dependent oxidoreductase [Eggerthellaceae bacterium]
MRETTLTRRSFVKALAVGGAAAAMSGTLSGCMQSVESSSEGVVSAGNTVYYPSICHGCIAACPVRVYVKDGVVVKIEGHPDAPMSKGAVCLKGMNQIHTCYSPRRVLYPMRRTGARGADNAAFERISWDEALNEATDRVVEIMEKYGTYSFFSSAGGGGSYAGAMLPPLLCGQLMAPTGFEPGAAQCWLPRSTVAKFMYGGSDQSTADSSVLEPYKGLSQADKDAGITNDMECLVIWGTQPSASQTAQAGRGLAELRAQGMKTVVVDPNFSPDATKATVHLPVRPGSDAALALSWFHVIFEEKLYDEEFVKFFTNLPFLINPETKLPWLATEVIDGYEPTTPDDTPVYVCVDENTGEVAALPFGAPADVMQVVNPSVFATATVNGLESKSAGQIYKEEAEPWTLERAEEFCWVPAERNREAIELYTAPLKEGKCAGITHGVATDQMEIASQMPLGLMGLDMIMGYVNKPGAALTQNGSAMSAATFTDTNEWGKCAAAGTQERPTTSYTAQLQYGYVVGATEEANAARVAATDATKMAVYGKIWTDRLGLTNHRGLSSWGHSHIPAIRQAVETGEPFPLKAWFELSGNKLAMLASSQAWYDAAKENVEYIFGQQPIFTSFHIELCDLVFPTEEWLEHPNSRTGQLNYTFGCPGIIHLGESVNPMHPWMLFNSMCADKLNERLDKIVFNGTGQTVKELGLTFPLYPMAGRSSTDEECWEAQKSTFAKMLDLDPKTCTNEELLAAMENRSDIYTVSTPSDVYWTYGQHLVTAKDGLPVGFGTESRKCEVYCTTMIKLGRTGWPYCYPVAFDEPVDERVGTYDGDYSPICRVPLQTEAPKVENSDGYILPFDEDFPLAITSGRVPYFHHGTMRHAPYARELYPAPFIRINPTTAAEYGVADGDWVEVSSRRTQGNAYDTSKPGTERSYDRIKTQDTKVAEPIHAIAYVSEAVAPNVVWMERFWNPECFDSTQSSKTGGWQECSVNVITNGIDAQFNEAFGSYNYRAFAVNIKKSSRPDRVWVQPEEFEPFMPTTANEVLGEVGVLMGNKDLITPSVEFAADALNTFMGK